MKYIHEAKMSCDVLVAVVNTDAQVKLKGAVAFMREDDRLAIVGALRDVDYAVMAVDSDRSISKTLGLIKPDYFFNGGDVRSEDECRESDVCRRLGIKMVFGVGGFDKIRSSSELIRQAAAGVSSPCRI